VIVLPREKYIKYTQKKASPAISLYIFFQFPFSHVVYRILVNDLLCIQMMVID